jgi:hypothetical protein
VKICRGGFGFEVRGQGAVRSSHWRTSAEETKHDRLPKCMVCVDSVCAGLPLGCWWHSLGIYWKQRFKKTKQIKAQSFSLFLF